MPLAMNTRLNVFLKVIRVTKTENPELSLEVLAKEEIVFKGNSLPERGKCN